MFIGVFFIIAPNWKQPKCPSTSERIGKKKKKTGERINKL